MLTDAVQHNQFGQGENDTRDADPVKPEIGTT